MYFRSTEKLTLRRLHWACIADDLLCATLLMDGGADIAYQDKRGYNALHHSAQYSAVLLSHHMMHHGIPVNCAPTKRSLTRYLLCAGVDKEGHTALHWTAYLNHIGLSRLLLKEGADINARVC